MNVKRLLEEEEEVIVEVKTKQVKFVSPRPSLKLDIEPAQKQQTVLKYPAQPLAKPTAKSVASLPYTPSLTSATTSPEDNQNHHVKTASTNTHHSNAQSHYAFPSATIATTSVSGISFSSFYSNGSGGHQKVPTTYPGTASTLSSLNHFSSEHHSSHDGHKPSTHSKSFDNITCTLYPHSSVSKKPYAPYTAAPTVNTNPSAKLFPSFNPPSSYFNHPYHEVNSNLSNNESTYTTPQYLSQQQQQQTKQQRSWETKSNKIALHNSDHSLYQGQHNAEGLSSHSLSRGLSRASSSSSSDSNAYTKSTTNILNDSHSHSQDYINEQSHHKQFYSDQSLADETLTHHPHQQHHIHHHQIHVSSSSQQLLGQAHRPHDSTCHINHYEDEERSNDSSTYSTKHSYNNEYDQHHNSRKNQEMYHMRLHGHQSESEQDLLKEMINNVTTEIRKKTSDYQTEVLNSVFDQTYYPSREVRLYLSEKLNMTPRSVQIWFQNRRQNIKTKLRTTDQYKNLHRMSRLPDEICPKNT